MSNAGEGRADLDRVKEIFHQVLESNEDQERLLGELCGGDDILRTKVRSLLDAHAEQTAFLSAPSVSRAAVAAHEAAAGEDAGALGQRVGPYKLLQQIGEGGFGVVYMAEQEKPFRRRVALKIIKPGMDTKQVIARFEAERQALAMLDHPNIAKVFDAGATPTGRPYFAMELVKGIPITDYCDEQKLGARERLRLFAQVCGAVHHAHENGIVHRDIKPSNVMMTEHDGTPVPKVIDFGVAKAMHQKLTDATLFTEYNQFVGTPQYMAPEQAVYAGLEIDRRSDVYSLGALLYELLTGTTPFEARSLRKAAQLEVLRILKEEEPPRPSTRVQTLGRTADNYAKSRRSDPERLARLLKGDVDWIVMKALEKDRSRRYGTAAELAADIGRYFEERPIEARPPSLRYRARKLMRRRRGPMAAAAITVLAVLADVGWVGWQRSQMAAAAGAAPLPPASELLVGTEETDCFFDGTPSPDGTRILHTDWCTGDLYVRNLESGTMDFVTEYDFAYGGAWLPDGRRISVGPRGPFDSPTIIDLETGARHVPERLEGLPLTPIDWSVDGNHLVGLLGDDEGSGATVLMSLSDGTRTVVKAGGGSGATFSPDGRHLLFADSTEPDRDLTVLEVQSGDRWPLVESPADEARAFWSPDGTMVAYRTEGGLLALPVSSGRAAGRSRIVTATDLTPLGWNERGYFHVVHNSVQHLYRIEVDPLSGEATGRREEMSLPDRGSNPVLVQWAPDMGRMAVTSRFDGKLHITSGEATTTFAIPGQRPQNLWWSEDGREVFLTDLAWGYGNPIAVHAVDVETGGIRELFSKTPNRGRFHISSDGERMVWVRVGSDPLDPELHELVISAPGGGEGQVLARSDERGVLLARVLPRFSPDGAWILFGRIRSEEGTEDAAWSLWVIRPDGSEERMLDEGIFLSAAEWDPTGQRIAYEINHGESKHLRVVSVDEGTSQPIGGAEDLEEWRLLDWSPDGAWLAVRESVGGSEIWVNRDLLSGSGAGAAGGSP